MYIVIFSLVFAVIGGLFGQAIGRRKDKPKLGFWIGFALGGVTAPFGGGSLLVIAGLIALWAWIGKTLGEVLGNARRGMWISIAAGVTTTAIGGVVARRGPDGLLITALVAPLVLGLTVLFGVIGQRIARPKGRETFGFWMGFWFGVIGWIVAALVQSTPEARADEIIAVNDAVAAHSGSDLRPCPLCAEPIRNAAVLCRYCGNEVAPAT